MADNCKNGMSDQNGSIMIMIIAIDRMRTMQLLLLLLLLRSKYVSRTKKQPTILCIFPRVPYASQLQVGRLNLAFTNHLESAAEWSICSIRVLCSRRNRFAIAMPNYLPSDSRNTCRNLMSQFIIYLPFLCLRRYHPILVLLRPRVRS